MIPTGNELVAIESAVPATEMVSSLSAVRPPASVTRTVNVKTASLDAVGVPETTPVVSPNVSPAGRLPFVVDHVNGPAPPADVSVCEYGVERVAGAKDDVVIASGSTTRRVNARVELRRFASVT